MSTEIRPREHQAQGLEIMETRPNFLFAWKPGTGKTFLMLFRMQAVPKRTLVIAQKSIIPTAWADDASAIGYPTRVISARDRKADRAEQIRSCPANTTLIMNHEMVRAHQQDLRDWGVERLVVDESSKFKNRDTKVWKAVVGIADSAEETYLLSGTPAPNSPIELWGQLRLLSPRAAGRSFFPWAYQWFVPIKVPVRGRGGKTVISEWVFKHGKEKLFYESLKPWVWFLSKEECVDLPPSTDSIRLFDLSREERRVYDDILDDYRIEVGDSVTEIRSEGQAIKLRQATGGSILIDKKPVHTGSSKLDELFDTMDEIGPGSQVLVWAEFVEDISRIVSEINRGGTRMAVAVNGQSTMPIESVMSGFAKGDIQVVVAHPRSMGHGTDGLQKVCNHAIYFGLSYSGEEHEQSRDRLSRSGQTSPCTFHYLLARDTIDEGLLAIVKGKMSKQGVLLNELKRPRQTRRSGNE